MKPIPNLNNKALLEIEGRKKNRPKAITCRHHAQPRNKWVINIKAIAGTQFDPAWNMQDLPSSSETTKIIRT
jgi:hypothetical protein